MHTSPYAYLDRLIGKRIKLQYTNDPYTDLRQGDEGVVDHIDDGGTVFAKWDSGSCLGLNTEFGDRYVVIQEEDK